MRPTAVAGTFYPAGRRALAEALDRSFAAAVPADPTVAAPKALVVPHAGYVYSGPIAGSAYARLAPAREVVERVVLLGPSHRVPLRGLAVTSADAWDSPLGPVRIDADGRAAVLAAGPMVRVDDRPHAPEHSLEVQVPFLQRVLADFALLPLVVGDASADEVAAALAAVWGGPETLIVISTDLSHYHPYEEARTLDARTAAAIATAAWEDIGDLDACGARPLRGLLRVARSRGLHVEALDLRNSGDTAGDRGRVVGYGAFAVG